MSRKSLILWGLVSFLAGLFGFLASVLGHFVGGHGVSAAGLIGGAIGVFAGTQIARRRGILSAKRYLPATIGGLLGLILAAIIAVNHLHTPVIPIASILLIGLGAAFGAASRHGTTIDR
jgi:O-antigen/teichoic acid export membrane protein